MKHMKKFLALALVALSIFAVAIPAMAATTKHVNISPDVNMRDRIGGSVIIRVPQGARVDVESTSVNNGVTWAKVKFGNMNGYIMDTYLSTGAGETYPSNSTQAFSLSTLQVSSKKLYMIKNLQLALNYGGYNARIADGVFGSSTQNAVKAFQRAKGLAQDGIVGPDTRAALWTTFSTFLSSNGVMYIAP